MQGCFRWVVELKRKISGYARKIIYNFNKYDFFVGESFTLPGKHVTLDHREDGVPFLALWKHGAKAIEG
ncbi:hypothetical protein BDV40DRAFT_298088 [Aspergillus tamarii]|uniref:Translationally-controlled tumor protein homolog n=1 Tax=Aspergillus tamarii TaxID=41984 RepID=A0A5N6V1K8_ASPTM|nr:hypothetical protein BDV40DRAFT_298088 [Aspergillus tamarii]